MKRFLFLVAALAIGTAAHAGGLPFAVDSFQKAQALVKQDSGKHVLVFYTSDN
jgi:hypothetical protein